MLERLGRPEPLNDPLEALLELGGEVRAYQGVLRERLSELGQFSKDDVAQIDRERAVVRLYGEALDRSHRVLTDLARLGLDERIVRVREAQAAIVVASVIKVLAHPDLALDGERQRRARSLLAAELLPGRATTSPTPIVNVQVSEPVLTSSCPTSAKNETPGAAT
jgi:hypothetical protein